ncbi:MAG: hypothetical protein V7K92_28435 [Nostoc sp.]
MTQRRKYVGVRAASRREARRRHHTIMGDESVMALPAAGIANKFDEVRFFT